MRWNTYSEYLNRRYSKKLYRIGVDGGFLKEAGIKVQELNAGCICCSLVGNFEKALVKSTIDFNSFIKNQILQEL